MNNSILVAGIGNIFNRDDGFGGAAVSRLAGALLPANVRVADFGIRGIDLAFSLLEGYGTIILVDAMSRGGTPGTLYAIEADLNGITEAGGCPIPESSHSLDPVKVLAMARNIGAPLGRVLVVGCEPATLEDDTGYIGLSPQVEAAVDPAVELIRSLIHEANECWTGSVQREIACGESK